MEEANKSIDENNSAEANAAESHLSMFEQKFADLMNGFGASCEKEKVETAIAIAIHPEEATPMVFMRGNEYEVARIMAMVFKELRNQLLQELDV
jgi:hypothetical protein